MIKAAVFCVFTFVSALYFLFSRPEMPRDEIYGISISEIGELDKEKLLYVYNWVDYIDPVVIDAFEKLTGVKVVLDVFDSNETLEVKLLAGNSRYDVVVPSATPYFARQLQAGVYQKLDKSRLPNLKSVGGFFLKKLADIDADNMHAVPYVWGISGFAVNETKLKEHFPDIKMESWALLFDIENLKKLAPLHVELSDSPAELFPAIQNFLGIKKEDMSSREALEKAFVFLKKIRPYIFKFNASAVQDLFNQTACVAMGTSGDIRKILIAARKNGQKLDLRFISPVEGSALWLDVCAIPIGAKHPKNAHAFINFLLHPRVIARITNYTGCANAVAASKKYIYPEILNDRMVYPRQELIERSYTESALSPELERVRTRMFTRIKSEVSK